MYEQRATVFGGTGFLGRLVVHRLARNGYIVRAACRHPEEAIGLRTSGNLGQVAPMYADVRNPDSVAVATANADVVVNCVGFWVEGGKGAKFADVHVRGAEAVAHAAVEAGARSLIHLSGIGVDATSHNRYIRARAQGEDAVRGAFPTATVLRPSVMFGPGDALFETLAAIARFAPILPLFGGGTARVQLVYVGNVADAVLAAAERQETAGQTYELGGPAVYTYRELIELLLREIDRKRVLLPVPVWAGKLQAHLLSLLPSPPLTPEQVELMAADNVVASKARTLKDLGIDPPHAVETILPTYMDRFRRGGRFGRLRPA